MYVFHYFSNYKLITYIFNINILFFKMLSKIIVMKNIMYDLGIYLKIEYKKNIIKYYF